MLAGVTSVTTTPSGVTSRSKTTTTMNAPPPPPPPADLGSSSSTATAQSSPIAALAGFIVLGVGLVGPGTVFSVMAAFFKPLLRRKLLQYRCERLANLIVPDLQGDVRIMKAELERVKIESGGERGSKDARLSQQV